MAVLMSFAVVAVAWLVQGAILMGLAWGVSHWLLTPLFGWAALSWGQAALVAVVLLVLSSLLRRS